MLNSSDISFIAGGGVASPSRFSAVTGRAGLKTQGDDMVLIVSGGPATSAAVFTRNRIKAAPVLVSAEHVRGETARAIVANSGNANCCTGEQGMRDARRMCQIVAAEIGCEAGEVLVCSTGIIGHPLAMDKLEPALHELAQGVGHRSGGDGANETAARAFMTTDTRPKFFAAQAAFGGKMVTVGGQAKGAGMIGPDMGALHATMLCFLTTDATVEKTMLQSALEGAVERSFNSVTIDGDTSTNDTVFLLANGSSGAEIGADEYEKFCALLESVCVALAREIARDGEGATRLITIDVEGANSVEDAKRIALTIANSPLVKTAVFGRDPNWGRIAAAAGRAGVAFDAAKLGIRLGEVEVFRDGEPTDFALKDAEAMLENDEVSILVTLGEGSASWRAWTCDYSYDYVRINAEYHT